jgi:molecular chaperone DnaK
VEIHVLQGARPMATDNTSLGRFNLDGIPPAQRGMPQIEVTFDIDANGILKVTALDKASGRSQHITITASSGLNDQEVEKMRKEAELHADEDRKAKELIEAKNNADNTIYTAEKLLKEFAEKIPAEMKKQVEDDVEKLRQAVTSGNSEEIRKQTEALSSLIQKLGGSMYQQAPGGEAGPAGEPGEPGEGPSSGPDEGGSAGDNVVDGEFRNA